MAKHLLIRADANERIGTGHVMRCLALAQAWQDAGGTVSLTGRELPEGLKTRLVAEQVEVIPIHAGLESEDAAELVSMAKDRADCVVLDGYGFGITHQRALRDAGIRQLFIDDYGHASEYVADFVLNQNVSAEEKLYTNRQPHTKLLLGTEYALLRREFRQLKSWRRQIAPEATKIMVTMGGADPDNVTLRVLEALDQMDNSGIQIKVAVGASNPHRKQLESFRFRFKQGPELLTNPKITELMQWADIAVTATGSTSLELLFMQLPFVGLAISDNQRPLARYYQSEKLAQTLQWTTSTTLAEIKRPLESVLGSGEMRADFARRGRGIVDGSGAERVVEFLRGLNVVFAEATETDSAQVWNWANEPGTRAASFESKEIPWQEHTDWFTAQIGDANTVFWIARDGGRPIGQVRFVLDGPDATISIGLEVQERGKGYGEIVIRRACERLCRERPGLATIHAYIKPENTRSTRAFERAGFIAQPATMVKGIPSLHYVLGRMP